MVPPVPNTCAHPGCDVGAWRHATVRDHPYQEPTSAERDARVQAWLTLHKTKEN